MVHVQNPKHGASVHPLVNVSILRPSYDGVYLFAILLQFGEGVSQVIASS